MYIANGWKTLGARILRSAEMVVSERYGPHPLKQSLPRCNAAQVCPCPLPTCERILISHVSDLVTCNEALA